MSTEHVKGPSTFVMVRALAGVATLSGLLIVLVYQLTFPIIKINKAEFLKASIFKVLDGTKDFQKFVNKDGKLEKIPNEQETPDAYFACYDDSGKLIGFAIQAAGMGFADVIKVLYGYSIEKEAIVGHLVLETKETPGLGDKIEKDPQFLKNFDELDVKVTDDKKSLVNLIQTVKKGEKTEKWQIDTITGATITSKAIGRILHESTKEKIPVIQQNLQNLMPPRAN
ncbi:MAG: FMN-binding protein [Spirochaetia bacterium]|nr:FMN-binding protein [Spirochaetia bacterium]